MHGNIFIEDVTVFRVNFLQTAVERLSDVGIIAHHFRAEHRRDHGVLIPRVRAAQIPAGFLEAEYVNIFSVRLPLLDFFADKLKSDGRFKQGYAEIVADRLGHARGDKGFDDGRIGGHRVFFLQPREDIIEQQNPHLIARQGYKFSAVVLDGDAEPVRIGVCAEHHVGMYLICQRNPHGQGFLKFGIGHFHGGKLGILGRLFLHDGDVYPQFLQNDSHGHIAAAVHGRIDQL